MLAAVPWIRTVYWSRLVATSPRPPPPPSWRGDLAGDALRGARSRSTFGCNTTWQIAQHLLVKSILHVGPDPNRPQGWLLGSVACFGSVFPKIRPVGRPSSTKQTVLHDFFCKVVLQLRYLPLETPCCRDVFAWFSSTTIELKITLILGHVAYATPGQD